MDVVMLGHGLFDALEELKKLPVMMARFALGENSPGRDIECGKQSCGAMANVVGGDPID